MKKLLAASAAILLLFTGQARANVVNVGAGSYSNSFPGTDRAGRNGYIAAAPQLSGKALGRPVPTNDWWSNELVSNHGNSMFNYPLGLRTQDNGLAIIRNMFHQATMQGAGPLEIGLDGLSCPQTTVCDYSDWTVTFSWGGAMDATVAQGSPFVYFTRKGNADVKVNAAGNFSVLDDNILLVTDSYNSAAYAVYAPSGATWTVTAGRASSDLGGKDYFAAVLLPQGANAAALARDWARFAFVFPADTRADFSYNPRTAEVTTVYSITPDVKEGDADTFLAGLLPHHRTHVTDIDTYQNASYATVRGELKMAATNSFTTSLRFHGILPTLPAVTDEADGFSQAELDRLMTLAADSHGLTDWTDSYNDGQLLNRLVQVGRIARQSGNDVLADRIVKLVKERLEDWLSYKQSDVAFMFYYHREWSTLLGYPAGHGQDTNINDHHFHWGYLIHSAAFVEENEPGWKDRWGAMTAMLVRDAACADRNDSMFPYLRNFSPYAGHSWANGTANIGLGCDQESSSESMQFACSLILWGELTADTAMRDLGIYLYTTEQSAIEEYWFDVHDTNLEPSFTSATASRIFTNSYDDRNFWGAGIEGSYGIQIYPVHAGSMYLADNPAYARKLWKAMCSQTGILDYEANDNIWYDTWTRFYAMTDPTKALKFYRDGRHFGGKFGESEAHTYQWVHALAQYGTPDRTVTASSPLAIVLDKRGARTYIACNYSSAPVTVDFSDGYSLTVPARSLHCATEGEPGPELPGDDDDDEEEENPGPGNDENWGDAAEKTVTFTADEASQPTLLGSGYIKFSYNGTDVKISAHFDGDYIGFAGPWLWNYTDGFSETSMTPDGDGVYSAVLSGYKPGTTLRVAAKVAYAGGMGVSPVCEYTIPQHSGIDSAAADEMPGQYYDLTGMPVANPSAGIYLLRRGSEVRKVVLK